MKSDGWIERRDVRALAMGLSILAVVGILGLHYGSTLGRLGLHDLLRRLFYLPIIVAAIAAGWRGGLLTSGIAVIGFIPHLQQLMRAGDRMVDSELELILMPVVGLIVGGFADSSRQLRAIAVEQGRLATIGEVGVAVMKQMEGPLGGIEGQAQSLSFLGARMESRSVSVSAELIRGEVRRVRRFLDDLRGLGGIGERGKSRVDLSAVLRELVQVDLWGNMRLLTGRIAEDMQVFVDGGVVAFSLRSLLNSLLEAVPLAGRVELNLVGDRQGRAVIEIRISCRGRAPADFGERMHAVFGARPGEYHFQPALSHRSLIAQGASIDFRSTGETSAELRIRFQRIRRVSQSQTRLTPHASAHGAALSGMIIIALLLAGSATAIELPRSAPKGQARNPRNIAKRATTTASERRAAQADAWRTSMSAIRTEDLARSGLAHGA